ncbi:MAG: hypothetical protein H8D22_02365 [Candidatus Cloacimonetes bacterium]|nr:hypothetical protein [Candidatus Cloacimonadota bacterium]
MMIVLIILILNPLLLRKSLSALLHLSPLFFSIFFLGFIFGSYLQKDVIITVSIAILVCFTIVLIHTTSEYALLKNIRGILPYKFFDNFIVFIYGIINFIPILNQQFYATMNAYKLLNGKKVRLSEFPILFSSLLEKSLYSVHQLSMNAERYINSKFRFELNKYDSVIPLIVIFQLLLFIIL